jgi:hypothetical protein
MSLSTLTHTTSVFNTSNKTTCIINITLGDECNKGYEGFSITATIRKKSKTSRRYEVITGGCCHKQILEVAPELQLFVDLHLCDFRGYPMYYIDNSYYYLKYEPKNEVEKKLKLKEGEYDLLSIADNIYEFEHILINKLANNLVWEDLGRRGVKLLESLTGNTFVSKATKLTHYRKGDDEKPKQTTPAI